MARRKVTFIVTEGAGLPWALDAHGEWREVRGRGARGDLLPLWEWVPEPGAVLEELERSPTGARRFVLDLSGYRPGGRYLIEIRRVFRSGRLLDELYAWDLATRAYLPAGGEDPKPFPEDL